MRMQGTHRAWQNLNSLRCVWQRRQHLPRDARACARLARKRGAGRRGQHGGHGRQRGAAAQQLAQDGHGQAQAAVQARHARGAHQEDKRHGARACPGMLPSSDCAYADAGARARSLH